MLELLSVDKKFHRQGAGSALVQWGTRKADEEGLEVRMFSSCFFCVNLCRYSLEELHLCLTHSSGLACLREVGNMKAMCS